MYKTSLYRVEDKNLVQLKRTVLGSKELQLQQWIWEDPTLLGESIALLGREVFTASDKRIDLLGIDKNMQICVIELKRDKTPRDVVAQALDYASWIATLSWEDLDQIALKHFSQTVSVRYQELFGDPLDLDLAPEPRMIIIASRLDEASERIARFLTDRGIAMNALFFSVFQDGSNQLLSSSWLMDPDEAEERTAQGGRNKPAHHHPASGFWFVNVGASKTDPEKPRSWNDNRRFGFMSASGGPKYEKMLANIALGGYVYAWLNGSGYVGLGVLRSKPVPIAEFTLADGTSLKAEKLEYPGILKEQLDPDQVEHVIGINWIKTVDPSEGIQDWHSVMTACALNKPDTLVRLNKLFGLSLTG